MSCTSSRCATALSLFVGWGLAFGAVERSVDAQSPGSASARVPRFEVDRSWQWPPPLPNNWAVGIVTGVAVDRHGHVWVMHRSRQVLPEVKDRAAPPILEFDAEGKFLQAWGGPGEGYDWPDTEHGLSVDHSDNVWITGLNPLERSYSAPIQRTDDMILKFTNKGKFIRQFGGRDRHPLKTGGNADTSSVHLACEAVVHPKTNELFVADGYANRRVVVLDADTLTFKRMWGAFGKQPSATLGRSVERVKTTDPKGPDVFDSVHAIKVSNDGLVYVGDRNYRRVQVFTLDGKYLNQVFVNPNGDRPNDGWRSRLSARRSAAVLSMWRTTTTATCTLSTARHSRPSDPRAPGRQPRRAPRSSHARGGRERKSVDRRDTAASRGLARAAVPVQRDFLRRPRGRERSREATRTSHGRSIESARRRDGVHVGVCPGSADAEHGMADVRS